MKLTPKINLTYFFWFGFLFVFIAYCALYIKNTSFLIGDTRFFCLFDDAMISMKYAKNLAQGYGLVWNPAEYVEGYTNFLWTIWMSLLHLLPVPLHQISLYVQVSSLILLIITLFLVFSIGKSISDSFITRATAVFLTAFYYPIINWSLQGMELPLQLAFIYGAFVFLFYQKKSLKFSVYIYILMGFGLWIRMDMLIPYLFFLFAGILFNHQNKMHHLKYGIGILVFSILLQTILRYAYYGEILPNTYYTKLFACPLNLRIQRGLLVFFLFIKHLPVFWIVLFGGAFFLRKHPYYLGFLGYFLLETCYSIYTGGDAWERGEANRFISLSMPGVFIAFAISLEKISNLFFKNHIFKLLAFIGLSLIAFFELNGYSPGIFQELSLLKKPYEVVENQAALEKALLVKMISDPDALIGVSRAGVIPYFAERNTIDFLGKTDPFIARSSMKRISQEMPLLFRFFPGHVKWDYSYSIGQKQPDIIANIWIFAHSLEEAKPFLKDYTLYRWPNPDFDLYLKKGSSKINWSHEALSCKQ